MAPVKLKKRRPPTKKVAQRKSPRRSVKKTRPPRRSRPAGSPAPNEAAKALAHRIAALALDKKAFDVVILDVRGMTGYADYLVLASGDSERQVGALAEHVRTKLKEESGLHTYGTEGYESGHWVLLDYGDVIAHLFFTEARAFYDIEGLWADAPREKLA